MKSVINFLSAAMLFLCTPGLLLALEESNGNNSEEATKKKNELAENFPFSKSESPIEKDKVVGLRIEEGKVTLLGRENRFYSEGMSGEDEFSNLNFFSQYPDLLSVEIKDITLSSQDLENICNFISSSKKIKNLVFNSCVIAEEDTKYIAETIEKLDSLIAVSVKFIKTKDKKGNLINISPQAIQEITQAISGRKNLTSLSVVFDVINSKSCEHIISAINQSNNMAMLSLCLNEIAGEEAEKSYNELSEALSSLKDLKTLCFSIMFVPEACIDTQIKSISKLQKLTNLTFLIGNLKDTKQLFEHATNFGKALEKLPLITSLRLQNMELPATATQPIMQSFSKLTKLSYLDMSGNTIDKEGGVIVGDSLKNAEGLRALIMRNCRINSETAVEISKAFSSTSLAVICLGNNKIKDGIKNLQLSDCHYLRYIDLAMNGASAEDIMAFAENTISHESLNTADLRNNSDITGKQRDDIARMKADKKSTIMYLIECDLPKQITQKKIRENTNENNNQEKEEN